MRPKSATTTSKTSRAWSGWASTQTVWVLGVVVAASCTNPAHDSEKPAETSQGLVGGSIVPNPESTGHVQLRINTGGGSSDFSGSGTLLDPSTVLTVGHNLDLSLCPRSKNSVGNTWRTCNLTGAFHLVGLGNSTPTYTTTPAIHRTGARVSVHPEFIPPDPNDASASTGIDVAILKVDAAFNLSVSRQISSTLSANFPGGQLFTCYGYGRATAAPLCADSSQAGILRQASLPLGGLQTGGNSFYLQPILTTNPWRGDSGGPCWINKDVIDGVMVESSCEASYSPPPVANNKILAAQAFKKWGDQVRTSLMDINEVLNVPGLDTDNIPDAVFLLRDYTCLLPPLKCFAVRAIFSNGADLTVPIFPDTGQQLSGSVLLGAGNFDGDGKADLVGQVTLTQASGSPIKKNFYLKAGPSGFTDILSTSGFQFISTTDYTRLFSADFNNDSFADLEAETSDGYVDVYYGSASGLTSGKEAVVLPSAPRDDGLFALVTGPGERTYPSTTLEAGIRVPSGEDVHIEVFDGPNGTGYDRNDLPNPRKMCFRLWPDPDETGSKVGVGTPIAQVSSDSLPEAEYGNIYSGANKAEAIADSGDYGYRLVVSAQPCDGSTPTTSAGANSIKVRSATQMTYFSDFSLWGRDSVGPAVVPVAFPSRYNTTFDGTISGIMLLDPGAFVPPATSKKLSFYDADSDNINDAEFPGEENIANDVHYGIYEAGTTTSYCQNPNPSGDYWLPAGHNDIDQFDCSVPNTASVLDWRWVDLLATNMMHMWWEGSWVRMTSRILPFVPLSSARDVATWLTSIPPQELDSFLPMLLGELDPCGNTVGSSLVVTKLDAAQRILAGKSGVGYGGPKDVREFRRQLLATKLNVASAATKGQPLATAFVYGTKLTVAQAIGLGDGALAKYCQGQECMSKCAGFPGIPPSQGNDPKPLVALTPVLSRVNAADVTYRTGLHP